MSDGGLRERARIGIADRVARAAVVRASVDLEGDQAAAFAQLANHQELRRSAAAVRASCVERLANLLDEFTTRFEERGGTVFFAGDAAEARRYVIDLARERGVHRVVKAKSILTEEIDLNEALTAVGIAVAETDLGEWIVQLAGEPHSHIVAPALHMTRQQVGDLFREHGGDGLSDEPEELTAFARRRLREEFLAAEMGVSGCNFAVAETGTVCLVTNEGNGRMVTSVPPLHVIVMGAERIVADWEQLDLMMALLARTSTGQDLTVYTSMITGPRQPGEADGPDEIHLVVVDNGRSAILGTGRQSVLHCIRCGSCLNACPVYREIGGHAYDATYPGPIGAVLSPLLFGGDACGLRLASTLCGACYDVCPVKIPLQDHLLALRREAAPAASRPERALWRGWAWLWSKPGLYRFTTRAGRLVIRFLPRWLVPKRWSAGRDLPRPGGC